MIESARDEANPTMNHYGKKTILKTKEVQNILELQLQVKIFRNRNGKQGLRPTPDTLDHM